MGYQEKVIAAISPSLDAGEQILAGVQAAGKQQLGLGAIGATAQELIADKRATKQRLGFSRVARGHVVLTDRRILTFVALKSPVIDSIPLATVEKLSLTKKFGLFPILRLQSSEYENIGFQVPPINAKNARFFIDRAAGVLPSHTFGE